ncbi:MAG: proline racemase family protein [Sporolactobacillus sp.]
MAGDQKFFAIDTHTMGEPTRVILNGFPLIPGTSMMEKKIYLQKNFDYIRQTLVNEPRGHRDMFGAVILAPTCPGADIGVIFMDGGGYLNMCGHGSIGVATVAVERGLIPVIEPYTDVVLETPSGLIHTRVKVEKGRVKEVSIVNVPAFLYRKDQRVAVSGLGEIKLDIAFGGNFFALVNAEQIDVAIETKNLGSLLRYGLAIREAVNQQIAVSHPILADIHTVDLVEFFGPAQSPAASLRNVVVFGKEQMDRSPCGTGTSAKLATLYARGQLKLNEDFVYESIMGTRFRGRALRETRVGRYPAIIPEITGQAFIIGENRLVIDEEDPLKFGFLL